MSMPKPRHLAAIRKEDLEKMREMANWNAVINIGALVTALLPVIFYKRIPWIRNFRKLYSRILWSALFILVPTGIAETYSKSSISEFVQRRYALRRGDFLLYKRTGDILKANDEVRIVDA